jgi:hypothetical protein
MSRMTDLLAHYQENPQYTPVQALDNWVTIANMNNPHVAQQLGQQQNALNQMQGMRNPGQAGLPPGARTPSGPGQPGPHFMSPAMANNLLPTGVNGSPHLMQQHHTPSPASHAMVTAHSQQGTNSSAAGSVNTSPNVTNKRRRSTAKMEQDDGGGDMNGAKVKQSPRVGGNKRVKNN